jgi:hypothetical protein
LGGEEVIRDEILAMEPGRELDLLVAEKVLCVATPGDKRGVAFIRVGPSVFDVAALRCYEDMPTEMQEAGGWEKGQDGWWYSRNLPRYSTSIAAAREIAEKLIAHGLRFEVRRTPYGWWAYFGEGMVAEANTAPEAICRAALLAAMGSDA